MTRALHTLSAYLLILQNSSRYEFSGGQIENVVRRMMVDAVLYGRNLTGKTDISSSEKEQNPSTTPVISSASAVERMPKRGFQEVAGMEELKTLITESFINVLNNREIAQASLCYVMPEYSVIICHLVCTSMQNVGQYMTKMLK